MNQSTVFLVALCVGAVLGARMNEGCGSNSDCQDAGTTCRSGTCTCWSALGFDLNKAWVCNDDNGCVQFPGHRCRKTAQCPDPNGLGNKLCQPADSVRAHRG